MLTLAIEATDTLRCPRCDQALAVRVSDGWRPLGALIKRLPNDPRASLVCPLCGAAKRIPAGTIAEPDSVH